jgi:thiamine-monophosphate kinase
MKLQDLGEFGLIERIAGRIQPGDGVVLGIGDDAAALETSPGRLTLLTSDMLLEGVHFDLAWTDPESLGWKSLAVNLSDIAAMGAKPRHFLLSLALPPTLSLDFVDRFIQGMLTLAKRHRISLVGGDTCASRSGLVISLTLLGEQLPAKVIRRAGARPGDRVYVTGTLGDAALGLELLRRGEREGEAIRRQLAPEPRVAAGLALTESGLPTAMIDVSDGLLADLGHIAERSGVGARLELESLPLSPCYRERAPAVAADPWHLALAGGEDYELLFTAPPGQEKAIAALLQGFGTPVTAIGTITTERWIAVLDADGRVYPAPNPGYDHFA